MGLGALLTPVVIDALDLRTALVVLGLLTPVAVLLSWRRLSALDAVIVGRDDELALLRGVPLFDALPLPALETVARQLDHVLVPAGEAVVRQGEVGDRFYVVVSGRAEVEGDGRRITTLGPGDSFGEIALLRRIPRTATVRAVDELRLESLRGDGFLALMTGSPRGQAATSAARRRDAAPVRTAPAAAGGTATCGVTGRWRGRADQLSSSSRRSSAVSADDIAAPSSTTRANRSRLRSCSATTFSSIVSRETIR